MRKRIRWVAGIAGGVLVVGLSVRFMARATTSLKSAAGSVTSPSTSEGDTTGRSEGSPKARLLLAQAERARLEGDLGLAQRLYRQILLTASDPSLLSAAQEKLGEVNVQGILSPALTPDSNLMEVQPGDTLGKIAKQHGMTVELLKAANGLTSDLIRPGQRLKVIQANFSVVVDKSQNTLTLKDKEEVLKVYRCSTGKGGITPVGSFKIASRIVDPPWFTPGEVIPPSDPRNILGSRWLGFDLPGYGIHGTTDPDSVGKPVTQGCVRLTNADIEQLFTLLPEGTPVSIVE